MIYKFLWIFVLEEKQNRVIGRKSLQINEYFT